MKDFYVQVITKKDDVTLYKPIDSILCFSETTDAIINNKLFNELIIDAIFEVNDIFDKKIKKLYLCCTNNDDEIICISKIRKIKIYRDNVDFKCKHYDIKGMGYNIKMERGKELI